MVKGERESESYEPEFVLKDKGNREYVTAADAARIAGVSRKRIRGLVMGGEVDIRRADLPPVVYIT